MINLVITTVISTILTTSGASAGTFTTHVSENTALLIYMQMADIVTPVGFSSRGLQVPGFDLSR